MCQSRGRNWMTMQGFQTLTSACSSAAKDSALRREPFLHNVARAILVVERGPP